MALLSKTEATGLAQWLAEREFLIEDTDKSPLPEDGDQPPMPGEQWLGDDDGYGWPGL